MEKEGEKKIISRYYAIKINKMTKTFGISNFEVKQEETSGFCYKIKHDFLFSFFFFMVKLDMISFLGPLNMILNRKKLQGN